MKIRAFPERHKSHKRLKDLAERHALLWYTGEYIDMRPTVRERVPEALSIRFDGLLLTLCTSRQGVS